MSYNYLPLDRKPVNFQQVKNLLDFDQLLSVTFDAHERILHCRDYVDNKAVNNWEFNEEVNTRQPGIVKSDTYDYGDEISDDVIKLMLMLKIKSLSYGYSGVHIETVKRLLEMYNNGVLPVIYKQDIDVVALGRLSQALTGLSEVYYKSEKRNTAGVLKELNWMPLNFQNSENLAIVNGTQFTAACGLYSLKKAEQLISMANIIAALSLYASGCSAGFLHEKIHSIRRHSGQVECAAVLRRYLKGVNINTESQSSPSFSNVPAVHGAAMDLFEYVLNVFMTETNSVTESPVFFPDDDLILNVANNVQNLVLALDFLSIAICSIGNSSQERTAQLNEDVTSQAVSIMNETKHFYTPASIKTSSAGNFENSNNARCLQVINNVEKVLAIELSSAVQTLGKPAQEFPPALQKLVNAFRQSISTQKEKTLDNDLAKAANFIATHEVD